MSLSFKRLFSMGALEALRSVRTQRSITPDASFDNLVEIVSKLGSDSSALDFDAAREMDEFVASDVELIQPHVFYRQCIQDLVFKKGISWARLITSGRSRFIGSLERDEQQCFRAAQLYESPLTPEVVKWWDDMASVVRKERGDTTMNRAREAELLSFEHEVKQLSSMGIFEEPKWTAVEDNTAGYDVLSYRPGEKGPINYLIEVKSTIASPLRFFVTSNEWKKAVQFGASYVFYVWDMSVSPQRLYVRTVAQIEPHMPINQGKGKWASAEIPLSVG
jgi:hypothetical protein